MVHDAFHLENNEGVAKMRNGVVSKIYSESNLLKKHVVKTNSIYRDTCSVYEK